MRIQLLGLLLILSLQGCSHRGSQVKPRNVSPLAQAAVKLLRDPNTTQLEVLWVPKEIETRTRLTPQRLEHTAWWKVRIKDFQRDELRDQLIQALQESDLRKGTDAGDLRWACIFTDPKNKRVLTMYFAGRGPKGLIQGVAVTSNGRVVRVLEDRFRPK